MDEATFLDFASSFTVDAIFEDTNLYKVISWWDAWTTFW